MIHELSTIGWPGAIVLVALIAAAAYVLGVMFRS